MNLPIIVPPFIETFTAPVMPVPSLASSVGSSLARTSCNVHDIAVASVLQPSTLAMASQPFVVWSGLGICLTELSLSVSLLLSRLVCKSPECRRICTESVGQFNSRYNLVCY